MRELRPQLEFVLVGPRRTHFGTGPFLMGAARSAGCILSGVVASSAQSGREAAQVLSTAKARPVDSGPLDQVLARIRPDFVIIASPTILHEQHIRTALEHGAHCLVEKPAAAIGSGSVRQLFSSAEAQGLVIHANYPWPLVCEHATAVSGLPQLHTAERCGMHISGPGGVGFLLRTAMSHASSVAHAFFNGATTSTTCSPSRHSGGPLQISVKSTATTRHRGFDLVLSETPDSRFSIVVDGVELRRTPRTPGSSTSVEHLRIGDQLLRCSFLELSIEHFLQHVRMNPTVRPKSNVPDVEELTEFLTQACGRVFNEYTSSED